MSGFKRRQSKVFWNCMEIQDLGRPQLSTGTDQPRSLPNHFKINSESPCSEKLNDIDESKSANDSREENMFLDVNFEHWNHIVPSGTVQSPKEEQRSSNCTPEKSMRELNEFEDSAEFAVAKPPNEGAAIRLQGINVDEEVYAAESAESNRSMSQSIHSQRSQDSGFSDSERSESPVTPQTVITRRQIRKSRRQREDIRKAQRLAVEGTLESFWSEGNLPPSPAHTSTPKQLSIMKTPRLLQGRNEIRSRPAKLLNRFNRAEDDRARDALAESPSASSSEGECLGDFLYATEPPEDFCSPRRNDSSVNYTGTKNVVASELSSTSSSSSSGRASRQMAAVRKWLGDLAAETEAECCATLQSKALPHRQICDPQSQARDLTLLTASATTAATQLLVRADQFKQHHQHVLDELSKLENGRSERELLRSIEEDAFSLLSELGAPPPRRIHGRDLGSFRGILTQLDALKSEVDRAIDARLDFYIERVVRGLEEAPREGGCVGRGALAGLTALGLAGPRGGSSVARCSGVRALLTTLLSAKKQSSGLRAASLRALGSVCCSPMAIEQFTRDGGPEILTDLLAAESSPETEKMEAAALVVQITAPWVDAVGLPHLEPFMGSLVESLTRLAEATSCSQTLLLAAAALNHLAGSNSLQCVGLIIDCETVRKLLKCVKKSGGGNVWLMKQVASLIGELAKIPEARPHLAAARASVALVCFLRMRPPGLEDAYKQLEATASEALARLCVDPAVARQVVAVGGADCLPYHHRREKRNSMDENQSTIKGAHSTMSGTAKSNNTSLLRYTRSLRLACKRAAVQIDIARADDHSTLG